jgi:alpha/beta superfamily hydrolase
MPTLRKRWEEYRPSKTEAFWTAAGCVVTTLVIGFGFGGWVTGGTAQKMVTEAADGARHQLAAAICVEEFMASKDARTQLADLKKAEWYTRDKIIAASGWATMPDRKEPNMVVAEMCAAKLAEDKPVEKKL